MFQRVSGCRNRHVNLSSYQVLHRRGAASIRHELNLCAGFLLKQQIGYVPKRAHTCGSGSSLVGVCLDEAIKLFRSFAGKDFLLEIKSGAVVKRKIGAKSFSTSLGELVNCAIEDMRTPLANNERVAVGG
jgi:hypothetical protein